MSKFITTDPPYNAGLYPTTAGFLELANGVALSSTLTEVTDQLNTASTLYLSTDQVKIGTIANDTPLALFGYKNISAIFNTIQLSSTDKTFTFPDASMTFAGINISQTFTGLNNFTTTQNFNVPNDTSGTSNISIPTRPHTNGGRNTNHPTLVLGSVTGSIWGNTGFGTYLGINAPTGWAGNLIDLKFNDTTVLNITQTGAVTSTASGVASTPALSLTGTPFVGTGTTSVPLFYLNNGTAPTNWNNSTNGGTFIGVNSSSAFIGNFIDLQRNGAIRFRVASTGQTTIGPGGPGQGTALSFYPNKIVNGEEVTAIGNAGYDASMFFSGGSGTTNFFNGAFSNLVGVNIGTTTNTRGALLRLGAGAAAANSAPLKFTAGTLLTTPELGTLEYVDNGTTGNLYFTRNVAGTITRSIII